jgi:hypothetical protein
MLSGMLHRAISQKLTDVSKIFTAAIKRATMDEATTFEMSANFCGTALRNIPEDSHLQPRHHENLKYHFPS